MSVTGARISAAIDTRIGELADDFGFKACEHMVIFVIINGIEYHVDERFANFGPLLPLLLKETPEGQETPGVPGADLWLRQRPMPNGTRTEQKYWILETRNAGDCVWRDSYSFTKSEFLTLAFRHISYCTHRYPPSWVTIAVICTLVTVSEVNGGNDIATGTLTLDGHSLAKRERPTKTETIVTCHSEEDRIDVLREWSGTRMTWNEISGFKELSTEITRTQVEISGS